MYVHNSLSLITNNKIGFYVISTRMLINFELLEPKLNFLHVPSPPWVTSGCQTTALPLQALNMEHITLTQQCDISEHVTLPLTRTFNLLVTWCTNSLTFNNCTFCPHCIYVFRINLRTNGDLCHLQHKLIGFYNRDGKCLQRGTDWGFK
jgi:hypothetical protein